MSILVSKSAFVLYNLSLFIYFGLECTFAILTMIFSEEKVEVKSEHPKHNVFLWKYIYYLRKKTETAIPLLTQSKEKKAERGWRTGGYNKSDGRGRGQRRKR